MLETGVISWGKQVDDPTRIMEREDRRMTNGRREKY